MAWSIFGIITGIFALRGLFLGFVGVISKVVGFVLAYLVAFSYRIPLADFIANQTTLNIPIQILPIICSIALFFGTLFISGLAISLICSLLSTIIPPLKLLLSNDSIAAKIFGAITNGAIGALLVLLGIWGYDKATQNNPNQDELHQLANKVGNTIFAFASNNNDFNISSSYTTFQANKKNAASIQSNSTIKTLRGTATIVSEERPNKRLSIETVSEIMEQIPEATRSNIDTSKFLDNPKIQELLQNSELRDMALEQILNNPEKIEEMLNSPELQKMIESMGGNTDQ